ncbi:MAG: peptidoglycan-binding protein, partial [Chloroflexota bacterium]|nr:peptidoglycan-binding protein [Chloroflexota bacterium]
QHPVTDIYRNVAVTITGVNMSKTKSILIVIVVSTITASLAWLFFQQGNLVLVDQADDTGVNFGIAKIEIRDLKTFKEIDGLIEYPESNLVTAHSAGVLTYLAKEGSNLETGDILYQTYKSVSDNEILLSDQQIASANASVAQAELALANLNEPPSDAQIASANASVAQAELALANLNEPPSNAQVASANASVAQAELTKTNVLQNIDITLAAFHIARIAFCDQSEQLGNSISSICNTDISNLDGDSSALLLQMIKDSTMVNHSNSLLIADKNHKSAISSYESASQSLTVAQINLEAISELPSDYQLTQSKQSLEAAKAQRDALYDTPSDYQLTQAKQSLEAAKAQRDALYDTPSDYQLTQAKQSLEAAKAQRDALYDTPSDYQLTQAKQSLEAAQFSLRATLDVRTELVSQFSNCVLMYGQTAAWRDFKPGMEPGTDIQQLKENLILLGYANANQLVTGEHWNDATTTAIKNFQKANGVPITGEIAFGEIVFLPGTVVVDSITSDPAISDNINTGTNLMTLTPIESIDVSIETTGQVSINETSLQIVKTAIEVSDQDLIYTGSLVEIELPDDRTVSGTVTDIGSVAVVPQGNQAGDPYFEVTIVIDGNNQLHQWTGAPVTVSVTKAIAESVLSTPVVSLLALSEGGYALEVVEMASTRLIPVKLGVYADGWVEVTGPGLKAGDEVVVPR